MATSIKFGSFSCTSTSKKITIVESYKLTASYNTEENERKGKKPSLSRKGPKLKTQGFDITVHSQLGVSPQAILDQLIKICESGTPQYLYRNNKKTGKYKWILNNVSLNDAGLDRNGKLLSGSIALDFLEYIKKTGSSKETKAQKKRKK